MINFLSEDFHITAYILYLGIKEEKLQNKVETEVSFS